MPRIRLEGASWARSNRSTTIVSFMYTTESSWIPEPPEPGMIRLLMRMETPNAVHNQHLSFRRGECS